MSTELSPGEMKAKPEVIAMGAEVVWNMPNGTYMRMEPLAAINLAGRFIDAAKTAYGARGTL